MLLNPDREDLPSDAKSLHLSCMKISEKIAELNPDLLILLTPHGINLRQAINVYQPGVSCCKATGNAEWNNEWIDYSVDVTLDDEASQDFYSYLKQRLSGVQTMICFAGLSVPLRWGEVVPLYFALHQIALKTETNASTLKHISVQSRPKVIIIAQPLGGAKSMKTFIHSTVLILKNF